MSIWVLVGILMGRRQRSGLFCAILVYLSPATSQLGASEGSTAHNTGSNEPHTQGTDGCMQIS